MNSRISFHEITKEDDPLLGQITPLFRQMYDKMAAYTAEGSLMIGLVEGGEKLWLEGIKKMLGRLGLIVVAVRDGKVIGFINGHIHFTPDYLGSLKAGTIAHIFVDPQSQGKGIGRTLVDKVESWFVSKEVHSIGLQVVHENTPAQVFWEKCGYIKELAQYRKINKFGT